MASPLERAKMAALTDGIEEACAIAREALDDFGEAVTLSSAEAAEVRDTAREEASEAIGEIGTLAKELAAMRHYLDDDDS